MTALPAIRPRRSALYLPGANARALAKAATLPADVLILDLEDSVAPAAKTDARSAVVDAVRAGSLAPREVVVRVNAAGTPWHEDDLAAVAAARPDAVLLPKVADPADVASAAQRTGLPIWAMIETPAAILALDRIGPAPGLACLVVGLNDLAKETRARFVPGRGPMLAWLSSIVLVARAHGLDCLDGVFNAFRDPEGFRAECLAGRDLGFDGKTVIHPDQIGPANDVFAPDGAELEAARRLVALFDRPENAGLGVVALDGRMVERLHAEAARRMVSLADAIAARSDVSRPDREGGSGTTPRPPHPPA